MIREIEVKAKVRNKLQIEKLLNKLGCKLSTQTTQVDRIFIPLGTKIPVSKGTNVLRLRKADDKILFTLKQVRDNQLDKIEKEFYVDNEEQAVEVIQLLGFYESVSVEKKRRKCKYKEYEICIDDVKDLGVFIEVEKITADKTELVQNELFSFLETLGVNRQDRATVGYDILLLQKRFD